MEIVARAAVVEGVKACPSSSTFAETAIMLQKVPRRLPVRSEPVDHAATRVGRALARCPIPIELRLSGFLDGKHERDTRAYILSKSLTRNILLRVTSGTR